MHREDEKLHFGNRFLDLPAGIEAVQERECNIHERNIRFLFFNGPDKGPPVCRTTTQLKIVFQQFFYTFCNECVIVGYEDSWFHGYAPG